MFKSKYRPIYQEQLLTRNLKRREKEKQEKKLKKRKNFLKRKIPRLQPDSEERRELEFELLILGKTPGELQRIGRQLQDKKFSAERERLLGARKRVEKVSAFEFELAWKTKLACSEIYRTKPKVIAQ